MLVEYEKKAKKKCKYRKAYLVGHNSPSEVSDSPSDSEGDTDLKGDYYPLSLVLCEDSDKEVVMIPPVPP